MLYFLIYGCVGSLLLSLIGAFCRRAAQREQEFDAARQRRLEAEAAAAVSVPESLGTQPDASTQPVISHAASSNENLRMAAYGILAVLISGFLVFLNSYLTSGSLEVLSNKPGSILGVLVFPGWEREITEYDLTGVLISCALFFTWAFLLHSLGRATALVLVTIAVLCLVSFVVSINTFRVFPNSSIDYGAFLKGLLALGIASAEAITGYCWIEFLAVPSLSGLLSLGKISFLWLFGFLTRTAESIPGVQQSSGALQWFLVMLFSRLNDALEPLRLLDDAMAALFRPLFHKLKEGRLP